MCTSSAPSKPGASAGFLRLAISGEAGLLLLAWGLARWLDVSPLHNLRVTIGALLWGGVATLPLVLALAWMLGSPSLPLRRLVALVMEHLGPLIAGHSALQLGILALVAGVSEEVLFRGVIQTGLSRWLTQGGALLAASLLFGLVHFASRAYALVAAAMGLYLGLLFLLTGSLVAPMFAHAAYDFVALNWVARRYALPR